jgi:hypothetical protein
MAAKKKENAKPLTGAALIKETCRRIRVARSYWDAHNNRACRGEREKAMELYESLSATERERCRRFCACGCGIEARSILGKTELRLGRRHPAKAGTTKQ